MMSTVAATWWPWMGRPIMNGSKLLKKSICFVLVPRPPRRTQLRTPASSSGLRSRIWSFLSSLGPNPRFFRSVNGFTFLAVMFAIVLIGLSLTGAVQQWKTIMQRERETELLFRGDQIRKAIAAYVTYCQTHAVQAPCIQTPGTPKYPQKLEDLVKVPNISDTKRFLRKVYKDPITNEDWVLVKVMGDRIGGVKSKSEEEPLKQANFPDDYKFFEGKKKYSEWVFQFTPGQVQSPQQVQSQQQPPRSSVPR